MGMNKISLQATAQALELTKVIGGFLCYLKQKYSLTEDQTEKTICLLTAKSPRSYYKGKEAKSSQELERELKDDLQKILS